MKYYYRLKLWYWWNYIIKKDEFHESLEYVERYLGNDAIIFKRQVAHLLDMGVKIKSIEILKIKMMKL